MIPRRLWYESPEGRVHLTQDELRKQIEPLVILGEAGMGKSCLLKWLADAPGSASCTARQLINCIDPHSLLGGGQVLVIDGGNSNYHDSQRRGRQIRCEFPPEAVEPAPTQRRETCCRAHLPPPSVEELARDRLT